MPATLRHEFEEFVLANSPALLRFAVLLIGDLQHAEDLLQSALWRTHRHWADASAHPVAYTRRALINLSRDRWRWLARQPYEVSARPTQEPTAPDAFSELAERDALLRAMQHLPTRQKATLLLRFWEDLSVDETAQALGCSTGTVKSNTSHGLSRLRVLLGENASSSIDGGHHLQ